MSEESDNKPVTRAPISEISNSTLEVIQAQKDLFDAQERANRTQLELIELTQGDEKMKKALFDFKTQQLTNIQTTFDILFKQTRSAATMFYVSFWLGFSLVIVSVSNYLIRRDPNDLLTIAFLGVGALAMLSFFLRDPAEKIQRTAGKLVQLQAAMRYHLTEISYWDAYFTQKINSGNTVEGSELIKALQSMRLGTRTIMRQIDESLDDQVSEPIKTEKPTKTKEDETNSESRNESKKGGTTSK